MSDFFKPAYERATFLSNKPLDFTRAEFDAACELWLSLSDSMQQALNEATWQYSIDLAREHRQSE